MGAKQNILFVAVSSPDGDGLKSGIRFSVLSAYLLLHLLFQTESFGVIPEICDEMEIWGCTEIFKMLLQITFFS